MNKNKFQLVVIFLSPDTLTISNSLQGRIGKVTHTGEGNCDIPQA